MIKKYWDNFYSRISSGSPPSSFAQWCINEGGLSDYEAVLEIGCGNGRDSFFFAEQGLDVCALDASIVAIANNQEKAMHLSLQDKCVFVHHHFSPDEPLAPLFANRNSKKSAIYCRFVLHAVTQSEAASILAFCRSYLEPSELLCLEFRTIHDPMMAQGEQLGENERMTDHYRRFIDAEAFRVQMQSEGWNERYFLEADGLSPYKDDDPVLARLLYEKVA